MLNTEGMTMLIVWGVIALLILLFLAGGLRVIREYQRAVVFLLGRFYRVKGPGLIFIIPIIQQMERIDLRVITMDVPTQDVISHDNVSVKVSAVIYFRVIDSQNAVINVEKYYDATSQLAQTTLRSVLGKHDLDEMLSERDKLNADIQDILDRQTEQWGIKVSNVEIKHVDLDESMVRAIAQQAEAERARRSKIILAEGEKQAAENLVAAAQRLGEDPRAIQLRYLQSLQDIAQGNAKTIVFPMPMDLLDRLGGVPKKQDE